LRFVPSPTNTTSAKGIPPTFFNLPIQPPPAVDCTSCHSSAASEIYRQAISKAGGARFDRKERWAGCLRHKARLKPYPAFFSLFPVWCQIAPFQTKCLLFARNFSSQLKIWMKLSNLDEKFYEFDREVFFGPTDGCMKKKNYFTKF